MVHGALVVDKPSGPTSHDVVREVRKALACKAGHTGTLDPLATGVLPLLLGKATRLMRFYQGDDKLYEAEIRLGESTETFDREGAVTGGGPVPQMTEAESTAVLNRFQGEQLQTPPMHSAVKVGGEPLYKAARRGEVRERPGRPVRIYSLLLLRRRPRLWKVRVHCSSGTYVRTLAHELGEALGCGAHIHSLRRLRSGPFELDSAVTMPRLRREWPQAFLPFETLLPQFPRVDLDARLARRARHGNPIEAGPDGSRLRLFFEGRWIALAECRGGQAIPIAVFDPI